MFFNLLRNKTGQYPLLYSLMERAFSLPTGSCEVEKSFSRMKFMKTASRNQLSEKTLESLILIEEKYRETTKFEIPELMIRHFEELREKLNNRKSKNSANSPTSNEPGPRQKRDQAQEEEKSNELGII